LAFGTSFFDKFKLKILLIIQQVAFISVSLMSNDIKLLLSFVSARIGHKQITFFGGIFDKKKLYRRGFCAKFYKTLKLILTQTDTISLTLGSIIH
jgi:hypothetical protein